MEAVTYSNLRQNLRTIMRKVNEDSERLTVTTNDGTDIVILSKDDYDSWMETFYLLRSRTNRDRLDKAIEDVEASLDNLKEIDIEVDE